MLSDKMFPLSNLVVADPPSSGKYRLMQTFVLYAGENAIRTSTATVRSDLTGARAARRRHELLNVFLLILDDFDPAVDLQSPALLEVLAGRAGRVPTVILSSSPPSDWLAQAPDEGAREIVHTFLEEAYIAEETGVA